MDATNSNKSSMIETLTAQAIAKTQALRTITRGDGTTYEARGGHASATEGDFQVYVVPVDRRISTRQPHYRVTYYLRNAAGNFKRVSKAAFEAAQSAK